MQTPSATFSYMKAISMERLSYYWADDSCDMQINIKLTLTKRMEVEKDGTAMNYYHDYSIHQNIVG